jgi:hypothetical protein
MTTMTATRISTATAARADRDESEAAMSAPVPVVAYPFHSFSEINDFCDAVRELPGVQRVRYISAHAGVLRLEVTSTAVVPLCVTVQGLRQVDWHPVHLDPSLVEIALN